MEPDEASQSFLTLTVFQEKELWSRDQLITLLFSQSHLADCVKKKHQKAWCMCAARSFFLLQPIKSLWCFCCSHRHFWNSLIIGTRTCPQFKFSVPLCVKPFCSHTSEPSSNCMRHALPLWVSSILFYSEWNRGWHLSNTTFLQYRMYKSHIMLFDEWIKFSFEKNCGAALIGKWNSKLWYQTRWKGSNSHPGDKMTQKFC